MDIIPSCHHYIKFCNNRPTFKEFIIKKYGEYITTSINMSWRQKSDIAMMFHSGVINNMCKFTSIIVDTFNIVLLVSKPIAQLPHNLSDPRDITPTEPRHTSEANQRAQRDTWCLRLSCTPHVGLHVPMATQSVRCHSVQVRSDLEGKYNTQRHHDMK